MECRKYVQRYPLITDIYEFGSVGVPFIKNIISAFDVDSGKELPYGQEGEICIHTPSMMLGYLNNQTETDNIIKKHDDGLLWVHSGDLGYISENGFVHISGRLKRYCLTFYNGVAKKVFSLDVEKKMIQSPYVENCVTVPVNHKDYNQVHAAYVILAKGVEANTETEAALYKYANENMDFVYRPFKIIFVNQYPRTKVGKINYRALELP
jgi:long-chain acyl-CoA synthetase